MTAMTILQPLPLGSSNFQALRASNQIYVDKTDYVFKLASLREKFFLCRPSRFGKSLLISTFESLFKHGIRDFKGLAIEKLWKEENSYHVFRLDFSEVKNFSSAHHFEQKLDNYFNDVMDRSETDFSRFQNKGMRGFLNWLAVQKINSVVLLIDEYDAPLTACLNNSKLFDEVRLILADFYASLKAHDGVIRFFFMTGITKFNKTNTFSELNNFTDISLSSEFGSILGYTEEEVKKYFKDYLERASRILSISQTELLSELTKNYDGFCFERKAQQHVFAPWSLLKFLASPNDGFIAYWFESGGRPTALSQYLKAHSLLSPEDYGKQKFIRLSTLSGSSDAENLTDIGLLTQTGYLTIKSVELDAAYVDYPNEEVRTSMAQLYMEQIWGGKVASQIGAGSITQVLATEAPESTFHILNKVFKALDYQNYPVVNEAVLRAIVQVYLAGAGLNPRVEVHHYKGRSDLEVKAGNRQWIFEFKIVKNEENAEDKLKEAVQQIQSKDYGSSSTEREIIRLALVFSVAERKFVRWKSC